MVVLGDAAVTDFSVTAGEPGDRPFDHRPVLTVLASQSGSLAACRAARCSASWAPTLSFLPVRLRVHRARSGHCAQATPNVANPVRLIVRVSPLGQVAVRLAWSTVKSSTVNPSGMTLGTGAGLTRSVWPRSASSQRKSPEP